MIDLLYSMFHAVSLWLYRLVPTAYAQSVDEGIQQVAAVSSLSAEDPRVIIVRLINIFLSVLGMIFLVLIIYAGFTWMTAGGEAQKVEKAQRIMKNAVIGLIIILSSWGITRFILKSLTDATGFRGGQSVDGGGGGRGGLGGSGLGLGGFRLEGIEPAGDVPIRNVQVRFLFTQDVSAQEASAKLRVVKAENNEVVAGRLEIEGRLVTFTPASPCPQPNADRFCFDANTQYVAKVDSTMRSGTGQAIACSGLGVVCEEKFRTGDQIDASAPSVVLSQPFDGQSLPQNRQVELIAQANDDAGLSMVSFAADGRLITRVTPNDRPSPRTMEARATWSTQGVNLGEHKLKATAFDVDSNRQESSEVTIMLRPESCFDGQQGGDETGVDCGGGCGACLGAPCQANNQCAQGVCSQGICVEKPVITGLSPNNGKIGSVITISGANFGTREGEVWFAGNVRARLPQRCTEFGTGWTGSSIVVEVPVGAQTGPVRVKNVVSGLEDVSNDTAGPSVGVFTVNDRAYPGICALTPASGSIGTAARAVGAGFGSTSDRLLIGNAIITAFRSWRDDEIGFNVPALLPGTASVRARIGDQESNPVPFTVISNEAVSSPIIEGIEPANGPVGQYITIRGRSFGSQVGTVRFIGATAEGPADVEFPEACDLGSRYWSDTAIAVKIPATLRAQGLGGSVQVTPGSYQIVVQRREGNQSSPASVTVTDGTPGPGLCGMLPDTGPIGTEVRFSGERFGTQPGIIRFSGASGNADAVSILEWSDQTVRALVPATARTGAVSVVVGQSASNPLEFSVKNCNENASICSQNEQCCAGSGMCLPQGVTCPAVATNAHYAWSMSTGEIPIYPEVVEECNPGARRLSSPSPWSGRPGGDQVCINADMIARFTTKIDPLTVNGSTFIVRRCASAEDTCENGEIVQPAIGFPRVEAASELTSLIRFRPSGNSGRWQAGSHFRAFLTTGIRSDRGLAMQSRQGCGDGMGYCFNFATRTSTELCRVGAVLVNPGDYAFEDVDLSTDVHANPLAADDACLQLNPDDYPWTWSVLDRQGRTDGRVGVTQNAGVLGQAADQQATSIAETGMEDPSRVTASMTSGRATVSGFGEMSVALLPFTVEAYGPNCEAACINAYIWARFSTAVRISSINPSTIELRRCADAECRQMDEPIPLNPAMIRVTGIPGAQAGQGLRQFVSINPGQALRTGQYYRVLLRGGANPNAPSVLSSRGQGLASLNSRDGFYWIFKTKTENAGVCTVDRVEMAPDEKIEAAIGLRQRFTAYPYSAPDACSAIGQMIVSDQPFRWDLADSNGQPDTTVARLVERTDGGPVIPVEGSNENQTRYVEDNDAPVRAAMSTTDQQLAEIIATRDPGPGDTILKSNIRATTQDRSGSGVYGLQCGQRLESVCPSGNGLTMGGCCGPRPTIFRRFPEVRAGMGVGEQGVCRNTEIYADFTTVLSDENIPTAFYLAKRETAVTCPEGTRTLNSVLLGKAERWYTRAWKHIVAFVRPSTATADIWCVGSVAGGVEVDRTENTTRITYRIQQALAPNAEYRMYVRGETNFANPGRKGLMSSRGVLMAQEGAEWVFRTDSRICEVNRVEVTDTSPESPYLYTHYPEEHTWRGQVSSINAQGQLNPITPVVEYAWAWEPWLSSERTLATVATIEGTQGSRAMVASANKNGTSFISGRIRITRDELSVPSSTGRVIENAKPATFIMCEQPWPPRSIGPFTDAANSPALRAWASTLLAGPFYNFSTMYCRDAGGDGAAGDLPELQLAPVPIGAPERDQGIVRQYLFTFRDPAFKSDGIGIRVANNPAHLSAMTWYTTRGFNGSPAVVTVDGYEAVRDGDTYYISASNIDEAGPTVGSYIYILSVNPNAKPQTRAIVEQLMKNFSLNINMTQQTGNVCLRPQERGGFSVFLEENQPVACTANWECAQKDVALICGSDKAKLRRDRVRLSDVYTITTRLETAKARTGQYPVLTNGSFIEGMSTSRWSSWSRELSSQVGGTLPNDPVNRFISCGRCRVGDAGELRNVCTSNTDCKDEGATCVALTGDVDERNGFDPSTCWNADRQKFMCPAITVTRGEQTRVLQSSNVYQYRSIDNGSRFELSLALEGPNADLYRPAIVGTVRRCSNTSALCSSDTDCREAGRQTGTCRIQGATINYSHQCTNTIYSASGSCSVNATVADAACRLGEVRRVPCDGGNGTKTLVCASDCRAFIENAQSICVPNVQCGNGRLDQGEQCDDGVRNGQYGFCSRTCQQVQGMCGDGILGAGELCDNGSPASGLPSANGAYCGNGCAVDSSCALSCRERAPHCGDTIVNGPEQCDGGAQQTDKALCVSARGELNGQSCDTQTPCAAGYTCGGTPATAACGTQAVKMCQGIVNGQDVSRQTCENDSDCGSGGRCVKLTYKTYHTRSCQAPGTNNQCTYTNWSTCRLTTTNPCGDGVVDPGSGEQCDEGAANSTGTGRCTPRCKLNVCGDTYTHSGVEECDFGGRNGIRPSVIQYGSTGVMCTNQCRIAPITGGYCGNGILEQGESCDLTQIPVNATCRSLGFDYALNASGGREQLTCNQSCVIDGCALCSSRAPQDPGTIEAVVRDGILQNRPLPDARVVLRYNGSAIAETYTDPEGRFRFEGIHRNAACGNYSITIALQGVKYNYSATDPAQRVLRRTSDPNDGYFLYQSPTFDYVNFNDRATRRVGTDRVILMMPRPGTGETIVIREWNNQAQGMRGAWNHILSRYTGYTGQAIDPQLVLPRALGYKTVTGGRKETCVVGTEGCERIINWNRRLGSLDLTGVPYAGLACFEGTADNTCSTFDSTAETIMYRRAVPVAGTYRYFLVDFQTVNRGAGGGSDDTADGNFSTEGLKNLVRIAWRDSDGMEHYQEVVPSTAYSEGNGSCQKYWYVFDQDVLTGNVSIVNKMMCNADTSGVSTGVTQFVDDDRATRNIDAVLVDRGTQ